MGSVTVLVIVCCVLNILCFCIGAKVAQMSIKGKEIKVPTPRVAIEQRKQAAKVEREQSIMEINMANIDSYDGTGAGQLKFEDES